MRNVSKWVGVLVALVALGACSSGGGSAGGSTSDFCNGLKGYAALFGSGAANTANEQQFEDALTDLTKKAPSEIKADMASITAAVKAERSLASEASADPSKSDSIESQFSSQSAAADAASTNIEKFAKDKCGIDLGGSASSTFSSVGSSIN